MCFNFPFLLALRESKLLRFDLSCESFWVMVIVATAIESEQDFALARAESFYQSQFTRRLVGSVIGTECRIYYYIITSGN